MTDHAADTPAADATAAPDAPAPRKRKASAPKANVHKFQKVGQDKAFRTWFRGEHTNFNPDFERMAEPTAAMDYVLKGWEPSEPIITPDTKITAFGSCFAENISKWLAARNYSVLTKDEGSNAYVVRCGEGMVNTFVIRQQFEWAFEGKSFEGELWHGYDAEAYGFDEEVRRATHEIFAKTDVFVLTFGLSEVWYDEVTGNVFWRTIPQDVYDPSRHKFRVSTVDENLDNIRAIYALIRKHRPDAKIICTLSPVPLIATFRPVSCISANSVSKAVLRVAVDQAMRELGPEGVIHYWPSYEIVTDVFHSPFKQDRRHLPAGVLDYIMMLFEKVWCVKAPTDEEMRHHWLMALSTAGLIDADVQGFVRERRPRKLRLLLDRETVARHPEQEASVRAQIAAARKDILAGDASE